MTAFKPLESSLMPVLIIFARYAHRETLIFLDIHITLYKIKLVSQFLTRIGAISVASHLRQHHTRDDIQYNSMSEILLRYDCTRTTTTT